MKHFNHSKIPVILLEKIRDREIGCHRPRYPLLDSFAPLWKDISDAIGVAVEYKTAKLIENLLQYKTRVQAKTESFLHFFSFWSVQR